jgi:hypothetical protein
VSALRPTREDLARAFKDYCDALNLRDYHADRANAAWSYYRSLCDCALADDLLSRDEGNAA